MKRLAIITGITDYLGLCNTKKQPIFYTDIGQQLNTKTDSYNNSLIFLVGILFIPGKHNK